MSKTGGDLMLASYRALDLSDVKGMFCGKVLADLGAEVIKVEKPGGDPARNIGPFYHDIPDPEKSLFWFALNNNKKGITLDIESEDGRETFKRLVKNTDFVIESFPPGYMDKLGLGYQALSQINPRVILTSITAYGQTGPHSGYKASDLEVTAMAGLMYPTGDPDRPPVRVSSPQSYFIGGAEAAVGTMIAHYYRERTGQGQHVDASIQESFYGYLIGPPLIWEFDHVIQRRVGAFRKGFGGPGGGYTLQRLHWPCRDGYISFIIYGGNMGRITNALVECMDKEGKAPDFLKKVDWNTVDMATISQEDLDRLVEPIGKFFLTHTKAELYKMALERRIILYPLNNTRDILEDPQLKSRDFWTKVHQPGIGDAVTYPGPFVRLSETPCSIRYPAPLIGEHNREILASLHSLNDATHAIRKGDSGHASKQSEKPVFDGVKVADFSWVAAGPLITKCLGQHGATVVRIESVTRTDLLRALAPFKDGIRNPNRSTQFAWFNNDKYGITLNLNDSRGVQIAKRLVAWSDVVVENFAPGVMERWGLGYEELKKVKPDIIMLSASIQGQTGPRASHPGTGLNVPALTGHTHLTGWPDRDPAVIHGAYTDVVAAQLGAAALIGAMDYHQRTGKGQCIDVSQYETSAQFLAPQLLDFTVNGRVAERAGNRCPHAAPHGVYLCRGEDRWCAIAVFTDQEWQGFCQAIGNPPWAEDNRFSTLAGRKGNEDELDSLIGTLTSMLTAEEVMATMQAAGVGAGVVQNAQDIYSDPQLSHRHHFWDLIHPEIGKQSYFAPGFRLSKTPTELRRPAPCLGEHNELVYINWLGMSDEEFVEMMTAGVFT